MTMDISCFVKFDRGYDSAVSFSSSLPLTASSINSVLAFAAGRTMMASGL
jgi:hypothetical protein